MDRRYPILKKPQSTSSAAVTHLIQTRITLNGAKYILLINTIPKLASCYGFRAFKQV